MIALLVREDASDELSTNDKEHSRCVIEEDRVCFAQLRYDLFYSRIAANIVVAMKETIYSKLQCKISSKERKFCYF